jgi:hypothetical protein
MLSGQHPGPPQRRMRALAGTAGVVVGDESPLPDRFDHPADRMMQHPVAKWRRGHGAPLGLENLEVVVCAGPIRARAEFMGEGHDLRFKVGGERHPRHLEPSAPQRLLGGGKEIPERRNLLEEITEP